jgi:dTDP-4-amino-4,6-dideoxygalactose transaminase
MMLDDTSIPVARPDLGEAEAEAAREAILSGWVTQGPQVEAFEAEFAAYVGAPYACAVSSCTAALHLALSALGVGPGDEVVTVSHSFIATTNAIRYCGARPVFVDIEPWSYNMDPARVAAAITPRTRAILPVHQIGQPCNLRAILAVAADHALPVVEDAACAVGSKIRQDGDWEPIGKPHGKIACFSFHPRKLLTTGEGGMLTTSDDALDRQFRLLRQHGMSLSDRLRHTANRVLFEEYPQPGYNYRLTDIQAAVGRVQLRRLPEMLARRRELAEHYNRALACIPGLATGPLPDWAWFNCQSYAVQVTEPFPLSRDALMQLLLERKISSRRGIMNAHQEGACADLPAVSLPHSEAARDSVLLLPLFSGMQEREMERVIVALQQAGR